VDFFFLYLKGSFKYFKTIFYTFKKLFNEQSISLNKDIYKFETNFQILKKQYLNDIDMSSIDSSNLSFKQNTTR
jgi:hypothetical protein